MLNSSGPDLHSTRTLGDCEQTKEGTFMVVDERFSGTDHVVARVVADINKFLMKAGIRVSAATNGAIEFTVIDLDDIPEDFELTKDQLDDNRLGVDLEPEALMRNLPKLVNAAVAGSLKLSDNGQGKIVSRKPADILGPWSVEEKAA